MEDIKLIKIAEDFNARISKKIENDEFKTKYNENRSCTTMFYEEMHEVLETHGIARYDRKFYEADKLYYQNEKLTVDMTVWVSQYDGNIKKINKKDYPQKPNGYEWKYMLLIEHENGGETWLHEMQKLCTINAPYKLIITYGRTEDGKDGLVKTKDGKGINLKDFALDILNNIGEMDFKEFVIMFGEENVNLDNYGRKDVYDIYKYDQGSFVNINKQRQSIDQHIEIHTTKL